MKISTMLKDLYGLNNYWKYIKIGDELWTDYVEDITGIKWNKIKVTYVRSGVMFFIIADSNILSEYYFPIDSFNAAVMKKAKLDPYNDLPYDKNMIDRCCFDDEFTEVINFNNDKDKTINFLFEDLF